MSLASGESEVDDDSLSSSVVKRSTITLGKTEITDLDYSAPTKSELRDLKASENHAKAVSSQIMSGLSLSEVTNMSDAELRATINETLERISLSDAKAIAKGTGDEISSMTHGAGAVRVVGNDIRGGAAAMLTASSVTIFVGNHVTDISYPHMGVYDEGYSLLV
ncbi:MAG: hypothetical protein ABEI52_05470, partial [Halobacteriaceae archaeon]